MALNSITKLSIGSLSLGAVVTTGYLGSKYLTSNEMQVEQQQKTTIRDLMSKEYTHILLSTKPTEDSGHWENNWNSYKEESQKHDTDIFGLTGWNKENPTDLTNKLKEKCKELISSMVASNDDKDYQNVIKYCSREVTITDNSIKDNLKIISQDNDASSEAIWKTRETDKVKLNKQLKILGVPDNNQVVATIKEKCNIARGKKKSDPTYSDTYEAYKLVCTKQDVDSV